MKIPMILLMDFLPGSRTSMNSSIISNSLLHQAEFESH